MNLARALYFYLLANHVMEHSPSGVEIILVELPSFLYLTSFTVIIVLWIGIAHSVRSMRAIPVSIAIAAFVVLNILLYAAFITLVILFEELPDDNSTYCGNRFDNSPAWPPKRIVNLIFRSFIAFVSFSLAISFQVNGFIIYRALERSEPVALMNTKSEKKVVRNTRLKFFWMALVASIGLLLQSLFLVIIIAIQNSDNIATIIILIFVEAVPCFLILLMLHDTGPLSTNLTTMNTSTTRGKSNATE